MPRLGNPIELIRPAGVSHRRGGGLPPRGRRVMVLVTKAANGKLRSSSSPNAARAAIASKVPDPLITGWASESPQKRTPASGGDSREGSRRGSAILPPVGVGEALGPEHRPVHAHAGVALDGAHHAPEARSVAAGHGRLQSELSGDGALEAQVAYRGQHRLRSAGADLELG